MGSMSVSSCICFMIVSCWHHVAVLNAAFCMTCSLLILSRMQEATIWKRHIIEPVSWVSPSGGPNPLAVSVLPFVVAFVVNVCDVCELLV